MSNNLEVKKTIVSELSGVLADAQTAIVAEYRGLTVAQMTTLRAHAHAQGVHLQVVKNTLVRRAVENTAFACLQEQLTGPLLFSAAPDPVACAKVLVEFAKDHQHLVIRSGAMNGTVIDFNAIEALSKLPGRNELLATLVATMQAPMVKLVRTLNEVPGKFVRTLAALRDARAEAA
ncbi:MAG TPA: 50S ribosomal protein L10 [Gammaproteobacteria bacterium]|nr:50S ribosomal protein L10 [Gammaproteobacteria bacterium]